jgi:nitrite reductase/ring-hydroxylating ferredoxin subunit
VSGWHEVGSLAELERDGVLLARIGGREIGVLARPDGSLVALRNRCRTTVRRSAVGASSSA